MNEVYFVSVCCQDSQRETISNNYNEVLYLEMSVIPSPASISRVSTAVPCTGQAIQTLVERPITNL